MQSLILGLAELTIKILFLIQRSVYAGIDLSAGFHFPVEGASQV